MRALEIFGRGRPLMLASLVVAALSGAANAQGVTLTAGVASGRDPVWKLRPDAGKPTWGIDGTGSPLNGFVWWDSFPGPSGRYRCELGAVIESDGQSRFRLFAGIEKVFEGQYPAATGTGKVDCGGSSYQARYLPCGDQMIAMGSQVRFWGESVYPCGSSHGQYTRFWEIRFTPISSDAPPPDAGAPAGGTDGRAADRDAASADRATTVDAASGRDAGGGSGTDTGGTRGGGGSSSGAAGGGGSGTGTGGASGGGGSSSSGAAGAGGSRAGGAGGATEPAQQRSSADGGCAYAGAQPASGAAWPILVLALMWRLRPRRKRAQR